MILTPARTNSISRFRTAQDKSWPRIARELAVGRKDTHWMWYVFPQLRALAKSETARYFGIADRTEALAYLDDQVLRIRLAEATMAVLRHQRSMFSDVDKRKLQACMTLFGEVVKDPTLPHQVLDKFYDGQRHQLTLDVLAGRPIPQQWTPKPITDRSWSAQGRVEVGRHWEKQIAHARAAVAQVGARQPRGAGDPMLRSEVESFVKGFGLSAAATRRLVNEWMADRQRAANAAWDEADEAYNR